MSSQTLGWHSIHLTYTERMEREAINYTTGCMFKFYHLSFFHQKSHCFLTLKILFRIVHSQSAVYINFTLPLFNEHYLINLSFAIRPISIHSIYAPIMSRQRHVIDDTLFSYVFCIQNIIKKTVSKTSTSLLYQNTRFPPTRIWNQESTSSVTHVSLMWSLIFVFLSASCSWKKNFIQLLNWLISKWFYILVQVQITETPQKLAVLNQIVESLHKFQDVTSKILEAVF